MKHVVGSLAIALLFTAGATANTWSSDPDTRPDGQTQFYVELTGEVPQRCMMSTKQNLTIPLDLKEGKSSDFEFTAWCNTNTTTGFLNVGASPFKNANGAAIALDVTFDSTTGTIGQAGGHALQMNMTVSNSLETNKGDVQTLQIKPIVNGFEQAGDYRTDMYVSLYPR